MAAMMAATAQAETRHVCQSDFTYDLAPMGPNVPAEYRKWQGFWLGQVEAGPCAGLAVETVKADGTVAVKMLAGKRQSGDKTMNPPVQADGTGKIENGVLTATGPRGNKVIYKMVDDRSIELDYSPLGASYKARLTKQ